MRGRKGFYYMGEFDKRLVDILLLDVLIFLFKVKALFLCLKDAWPVDVRSIITILAKQNSKR